MENEFFFLSTVRLSRAGAVCTDDGVLGPGERHGSYSQKYHGPRRGISTVLRHPATRALH